MYVCMYVCMLIWFPSYHEKVLGSVHACACTHTLTHSHHSYTHTHTTHTHAHLLSKQLTIYRFPHEFLLFTWGGPMHKFTHTCFTHTYSHANTLLLSAARSQFIAVIIKNCLIDPLLKFMLFTTWGGPMHTCTHTLLYFAHCFSQPTRNLSQPYLKLYAGWSPSWILAWGGPMHICTHPQIFDPLLEFLLEVV